jgi:hypothetical protein
MCHLAYKISVGKLRHFLGNDVQSVGILRNNVRILLTDIHQDVMSQHVRVQYLFSS